MSSKNLDSRFYFIKDLLNKLFIESGIKPSQLKDRIERLSKGYIGSKFNINDELDSIAYSLYFLPENIPKLYFVLSEVFERFNQYFNRVRIVYDIGCGTGTSSLVLRKIFHDRRKIILLDKNKIMLDMARKIHNKMEDEDFDIICGDFLQNFRVPGTESLFILMNVLSENIERQDEIVERIKDMLIANSNNLIVLIEPVNQRAQTILMEIRKEFKDYIVAPCLFKTDCPLIKRENDICHFNIKQDISIKLQVVINAGHRMSKFYYLVLASSELRSEDSLVRVLEYPHMTKYGFDIRVCNGSDVFYIKALGKDSTSKRTIKNIKPNDIIRLSENNFHYPILAEKLNLILTYRK